MKRWVLSVVAGLLSLLAGCGRPASSPPSLPASPAPAPAPSPTPSPGTGSTVLVHVLDPTQASVLTYAADPRTGQLSGVGRVAGPAGPFPARLGAHPSGRFVYAAEAPSKRVSVRGYNVDPSRGALTPLGAFDSGYTLPAAVQQLVVSRERVWVVAGGGTTGTHGGLLGFDLDESTGALSSHGQITQYIEPAFVGAGPAGNNLYLAAYHYPPADPLLVTLRIDGDAVTELGNIPLPERPSGGTMYPPGGFLFVADETSLRSFAISDGRPVERTSIADPDTGQLAVHPGGAFLAEAGAAGLRIYAFDRSTGRMSLADELVLARAARYLAWEPGGGFLYVSSAGDGLRIFEFDDGGGKLSEVGNLAEGGGPLAVSTIRSQ